MGHPCLAKTGWRHSSWTGSLFSLSGCYSLFRKYWRSIAQCSRRILGNSPAGDQWCLRIHRRHFGHGYIRERASAEAGVHGNASEETEIHFSFTVSLLPRPYNQSGGPPHQGNKGSCHCGGSRAHECGRVKFLSGHGQLLWKILARPRLHTSPSL